MFQVGLYSECNSNHMDLKSQLLTIFLFSYIVTGFSHTGFYTSSRAFHIHRDEENLSQYLEKKKYVSCYNVVS